MKAGGAGGKCDSKSMGAKKSLRKWRIIRHPISQLDGKREKNAGHIQKVGNAEWWEIWQGRMKNHCPGGGFLQTQLSTYAGGY